MSRRVSCVVKRRKKENVQYESVLLWVNKGTLPIKVAPSTVFVGRSRSLRLSTWIALSVLENAKSRRCYLKYRLLSHFLFQRSFFRRLGYHWFSTISRKELGCSSTGRSSESPWCRAHRRPVSDLYIDPSPLGLVTMFARLVTIYKYVRSVFSQWSTDLSKLLQHTELDRPPFAFQDRWTDEGSAPDGALPT